MQAGCCRVVGDFGRRQPQARDDDDSVRCDGEDDEISMMQTMGVPLFRCAVRVC